MGLCKCFADSTGTSKNVKDKSLIGMKSNLAYLSIECSVLKNKETGQVEDTRSGRPKRICTADE